MSSPTLIKVTERITSAGEGLTNEDVYGWNDQAAWVIDGATDVAETYPIEGATTSAKWLADLVSKLMADENDFSNPASLFASISAGVEASLLDLNMPSNALPPACSAGYVSTRGRELVAAIVGDVYVYSITHNQLLSDGRFAANESAAVQGSGGQGVTGRKDARGIADRRRAYLRGKDGHWILGNNVAVSEGVRVSTWPMKRREVVLISTDGFARAVEPYSLYAGWGELAESVARNGLAYVVEEIRRYEKQTDAKGQHFKGSDDVCALLLEINGAGNVEHKI